MTRKAITLQIVWCPHMRSKGFRGECHRLRHRQRERRGDPCTLVVSQYLLLVAQLLRFGLRRKLLGPHRFGVLVLFCDFLARWLPQLRGLLHNCALLQVLDRLRVLVLELKQAT